MADNMKKLLNEWREYLAEQTFEEVDTLRKRIFAANGDIKLSNNQLGQLTRYVDLQQAEDPLGAALIAAAIKVYYRAKEDNWSNRAIVKKYAKLEKHLKGLTPQAGRSPTVRAIDAFLGAKDPVIEKGLYRSPNSPDFAKAIIGTSTWFKSKYGINIFDPTLPLRPPKWASEDPIKYAAWQTAADIFVKTPFDALLWLWPSGGAVGKSHTLNLARSAAGPSAKKVATNINKTGAAIAKGDVAATKTAANATAKEAVAAQKAIKNIPPKQGGAAVLLDTWDTLVYKVPKKRFEGWYRESFGHSYVGITDSEVKMLVDSANFRTMAQERAYSLSTQFAKRGGLDPLEHWVATQDDIYDLMAKYNTSVRGVGKTENAGALLLTSSREWQALFAKAMEKGIPIEIPGGGHAWTRLEIGKELLTPQGLRRAVGKKRSRRGLFGVQTHEIGHIEFIQNYPVIGETFLKEWSATLDTAIEKITERIARRVRRMDAKAAAKGVERHGHGTSTSRFASVRRRRPVKGAADIAEEQVEMWVMPIAPVKHTPTKGIWPVGTPHAAPWYKTTHGRAHPGKGYHDLEKTFGKAGRYVPPRRKITRGEARSGKKGPRVGEWEPRVWYHRRVRKSLKKHDVDPRVVSDSFNLYVMRRYKKILERGMRDPLWFVTEGKFELRNFSESVNASKRQYFGASQGDIYYLNPEETFAELFSKASRHYRRQKKGEPWRRWIEWYEPFQSKAFPETAKRIDDIVKAKVLQHIKENIYRLSTKYKNYL